MRIICENLITFLLGAMSKARQCGNVELSSTTSQHGFL